MPNDLASQVTLLTIGMDSSAPTTAVGMIGASHLSASLTKPPRPKRCSW